MKPRFFATPADWRAWLAAHHDAAGELLVGFYKRHTGRSSITWPESVDEALCFGWIDGIRRSIDGFSYTIRFTPRRKGSIWSTVNIGRVAELTKQKRMAPAGLKAFDGRTATKSGIYSYEQQKKATLPPAMLAKLKANAAAWKFYSAQPPFYQRGVAGWVTSAKQEATRERRFTRLLEDSAAGRWIGPMTIGKKTV